MDKIIETRNLYTNFHTFEGIVRALNGVGIIVRKGETYALVGESGCGKSVTVRSMMRIVQSPGKIADGSILFFTSNPEQEQDSIDLLRCTEFFMQRIRGNDISMIFQEAGTALNPVFTIGFQVAESFYLHRKIEMLEIVLEKLESGSRVKKNIFTRSWQALQKALFSRELKSQKKYDSRLQELDKQLYLLEDKKDPESLKQKARLHKNQERLARGDFLIKFLKKLPFIRSYKKLLDTTIKHQVIALLTELGIPNPENVYARYPHELSGGMQQRIIIAIALACHPVLLIADEPTSNLDVTIQAQILDLIKKLKESLISSVLFISHDLGVVAEICDRVSVMYAGDVMETGDVKMIFSNPLHPYTKGLLNSLPKMDQSTELATIPGQVPNLVYPPPGCRFHPRCPHVMDICRNTKPPVTLYRENHTVSCYLYKKEDASDAR